MNVIGFLCVSLVTSTIQLHDSPGSRRACACSNTGFSSLTDDSSSRAYYRRAVFSCAFLMGKRTRCKGYQYRNVSCLRCTKFCRVKRFTPGSTNSLKDVRNLQLMLDKDSLFRFRQKQLCSGWRS
jgi:hypothetical protein